jgi:hypothetical protein
MDRHLSEWKLSVELIWSAAAPDYGEAACLAAEISRASEEMILRQAAAQALPILRSASPQDADRSTQDAARRRLGVIREVLHTLTTPRFGKRESAAKVPTPEECHRQLLGLPLGRRLSGAEIHRAYKRVAKSAHPDAGGSARPFLELSAARDALMQER